MASLLVLTVGAPQAYAAGVPGGNDLDDLTEPVTDVAEPVTDAVSDAVEPVWRPPLGWALRSMRSSPSVAGSASEAGEEVGGLLGDGPDGSTTDRSPRSADQASGTIADGGSTE